MTQAIHTLLETVPGWLHVVIISMIPIIELRGALPYAILLLKMSYLMAIPLCLLGNIIPAPFVILLAEKILSWMAKSKIGWIRKFGRFITEHSMKRSEKVQILGSRIVCRYTSSGNGSMDRFGNSFAVGT